MRGCVGDECQVWACVAAWLDVADVRKFSDVPGRCRAALNRYGEPENAKNINEGQKKKAQAARSAVLVLVTHSADRAHVYRPHRRSATVSRALACLQSQEAEGPTQEVMEHLWRWPTRRQEEHRTRSKETRQQQGWEPWHK